MPGTTIYRVLTAALAVVFAAALFGGVAVRRGCGSSATNPLPNKPDLLAEELSEINARWSADWEARRDRATTHRQYVKMRAAWRRGYAAEVRAAYERHQRPVPAWALREDGLAIGDEGGDNDDR